ncbi:hypothetical protein V8G54_006603 [Vigna mungo]|uniref:Uncharacterized protein n=1 Tax=Vigna mungo TaxID=3915 RepID=A0AAQ3P1U3_VIGMU
MGKGKVCVLTGIEAMGWYNKNKNKENRGTEEQGTRENRGMIKRVLVWMNLDVIKERAECLAHADGEMEEFNIHNVHANDICLGNISSNLAMFKLTMVQPCTAAMASVLSTVKYVKFSPARFAIFKACVEQEGISYKGIASLKYKDLFVLLDMQDMKFGVEMAKSNGGVPVEEDWEYATGWNNMSNKCGTSNTLSHAEGVEQYVQQMWDFQHTLSRQGIYISSTGLDINGWSDNGPIWGGTICPTNNKYH